MSSLDVEIVTSPSVEEIEALLGGNERPGLLRGLPLTETRTIQTDEQPTALVYHRASMVIDTATRRVGTVILGSEAQNEPSLDPVPSGVSAIITNMRDRIPGIEWPKAPRWFPFLHVLRKNDQGGGDLFGVELADANNDPLIPLRRSGHVRPATLVETLHLLEKEKPLEHAVVSYVRGVQVYTIAGSTWVRWWG